MSDGHERDLDELLSRHLHASLDRQLGRASAAFATHQLRRRRLWMALSAAAMAAGVAVAWIVVGGRLTPHPTTPDKPDLVIQDTAPPPMVQSATWSRVKDDGMTVLDDRPVRRLRRSIVEEVEWYDAKDRAMVKTTLPRQQIILIDAPAD